MVEGRVELAEGGREGTERSGRVCLSLSWRGERRREEAEKERFSAGQSECVVGPLVSMS